MTGTEIRTRPLSELRPNLLNPRGQIDPATVEDLAASIREQGILQPLLVLPDGHVVAGHRRLAASQIAGLAEVPVIERDLSEREQLAIMLVENLQREDLSPLQEARAYARLKDMGLTQADVARTVGVPGHRVQSRLQILKLCPEVQELYERNVLPTTLAPALTKLTDARQQQRFASMAARRQLPGPRIEELIRRSVGECAAPRPAAVGSPTPAPVISATRQDLISRLQSEPTTTISFEDLATAVTDTCCWCGMDAMPEVCANCPIPQLVARIVRAA
jgi:ParB family chromosome partitioning protein